MRNEQTNQTFYRRIGSTRFKVVVHFNPAGTNTLQEKIMRLIENEALPNGASCGMLKPPQMSRPPEGSSL